MAKLALPVTEPVTEIDTHSAVRGRSRGASTRRRPPTAWTAETWATGEVADIAGYARIAVGALLRANRQAEAGTDVQAVAVPEAQPGNGRVSDEPSRRAA